MQAVHAVSAPEGLEPRQTRLSCDSDGKSGAVVVYEYHDGMRGVSASSTHNTSRLPRGIMELGRPDLVALTKEEDASPCILLARLQRSFFLAGTLTAGYENLQFVSIMGEYLIGTHEHARVPCRCLRELGR